VVGNGYLRERYADVWVECGAAGSDKGDDVDKQHLGAGNGVAAVGWGNVGYNGKRVWGGKMIMGNVDICGTYLFE
jgi:hypothetical protein